VLRRRVWSRNIKNGCSIYIYDISRLRVNDKNCGGCAGGRGVVVRWWW